MSSPWLLRSHIQCTYLTLALIWISSTPKILANGVVLSPWKRFELRRPIAVVALSDWRICTKMGVVSKFHVCFTRIWTNRTP